MEIPRRGSAWDLGSRLKRLVQFTKRTASAYSQYPVLEMFLEFIVNLKNRLPGDDTVIVPIFAPVQAVEPDLKASCAVPKLTT
jgi:hypothetical protein